MNENGINGTARAIISPREKLSGCPPIVAEAVNTSDSSHDWFVMRSTYSREMKALTMLSAEGIKCYVPMRHERTEKGDITVPAVHNLIFVYTDRKFMDTWKRLHETVCPLRYAMNHATGKPMIVHEKEMEDFMRVNAAASDLLYLDNPQVAVEKGKAVEIIAGEFKGVRGHILRIMRDRKVVVSLNGLVAVALTGIPFAWIREI